MQLDYNDLGSSTNNTAFQQIYKRIRSILQTKTNYCSLSSTKPCLQDNIFEIHSFSIIGTHYHLELL